MFRVSSDESLSFGNEFTAEIAATARCLARHAPCSLRLKSFLSPGLEPFIATQTIPGTPTYSRKDQEYGAGRIGVPG